MYIERTSRYYVGSEQATRRARFLILMQDQNDHKSPIRAIVRKVAMRQCGHFMMGIARIKNQSIVLSGSYGADGLSKSVPTEVYQMGVPLPDDLYDVWNTGGGWNSAGSEASAMRKWANDTFPRKD